MGLLRQDGFEVVKRGEQRGAADEEVARAVEERAERDGGGGAQLDDAERGEKDARDEQAERDEQRTAHDSVLHCHIAVAEKVRTIPAASAMMPTMR